MKRKLLLGICAFSAIAMSAQSIETKSALLIEEAQKVGKKVISTIQIENKLCTPEAFNQQPEAKNIKSRAALSSRKSSAPAADVKAYYALPSDALHYGISPDFQLFSPSIILPAGTEAIFRNLSTPSDAECVWSLQEYSFSQLSQLFALENEIIADLFKVLPESNNSLSTNWPGVILTSTEGGWKLSPKVTVTSGNNSDSYFYSKGATYNNKNIENNAVYFPANFQDLTTADPALCGLFPGFKGEDESEPRGFGSGFVNSKGEKCTGILSMHKKPSCPLVIKSVSIRAVPTTPKDKYAVTNEDLTLKVYKVDGTTVTKEVLANAVCESAKYDSKQDAFYITFVFVDDEEEDTYFTLNQDAAIEISGFDKCEVRVLVSNTQSENGHAYGIYPSGLDFISYNWMFIKNPIEGGDNINVLDFVMNLNAAYAVLTSDTGEEYSLNVPTAGGQATNEDGNKILPMYSTFPFTSTGDLYEDKVWIANAPDWVKVGINSKSWGTGDLGCAFLFQVTCDELTSGTGRSGDIVFETLGGVQERVHVKQGDGGVGITSTEASAIKTIVNGDNVQLTYPEGVNTVAIVNIAGQTIASYELPANGTYNMSIANLNKGMYLLKFNNNKTAKIIK